MVKNQCLYTCIAHALSVSKTCISMNNRYVRLLPLLDPFKHFKQLKQIHAHIILSPNLPPHQVSFHLSKLASLCAVAPPFGASLDYAKTIFDHLSEPPISLWNNLIRGLSLNGSPFEAFALYRKLTSSSLLRPNNFTFPSLIKSCARFPEPWNGLLLHSHVVKAGLELDPHVQSSLIHFYASWRDLSCAKRVFENCSCDDVVSWNSMIDGCVKCEDMELARVVFNELVCRDVISWNTMINGYAILGQVEQAEKLFDEMPQRNVISWNSMLYGYAKSRMLGKGKELFNRMPSKDVVSWNAMLTCYVECGKLNEALVFFEGMLEEGMKPAEATFVILLSACAQLGVLDEGLRVHQYILQHKVEMNSIMKTALVNMYARCGNISEAVEIFSSMDSKDTFAWNTILGGMALYGKGKESLQFFQLMQNEGIRANDMTFVALLTACSRSGLVNEGQSLLASMRTIHGVDPKAEHYGCVVDLLARSGHLEEAAELVSSMPMESNPTIWGALAGGCRIHANGVIGEKTGKYLINLQPHYGERYALLSNIYSSAQQWEEAGKMRQLMESKGLKKLKGLSFVEQGRFQC